MSLNEDFKKELQRRKIQLWNPPYYGVTGADAALESLAASFAEQSTQEFAQSQLIQFRTHALAKLLTKGKLLEELQVKVIGGKVDALEFSSVEMSFVQTWAEETKLSGDCITLRRVNPELVATDFIQQLERLLNKSNLYLVHRGKRFVPNEGTRLKDCLQMTSSGQSKLMCLARNNTNNNSMVSSLTNKATKANDQKPMDHDQALIDAIRSYAQRLDFDITDGKGNLVPMKQAERTGLLSALGLHAVAKERMKQQDKKETALPFLLQSDHEWNQVADSWKTRVDNYGLLQLDICWLYLQLEIIESLPHATVRLDQAERVLRHQVHANFIKLALMWAEAERPVPAISAMFVRLFLLQGVAEFHQVNPNKVKSQERLDWAFALAKSLRMVSEPASVSSLIEVMGKATTTPFQAIAALRHTNGNLNQAAEKLQADRADAKEKVIIRNKQRELGLCENGSDSVDIQAVSQLETVLGTDDDDSELVAGGLLRLSNNDIGRALDMFNEIGNNVGTLLERIAALDRRQGVSSAAGRLCTKRRRESVDEVALASLLSMGVDADAAKDALVATGNNVDRALLWSTEKASATTNEKDHSETDSEEDRSDLSVSKDASATTNEGSKDHSETDSKEERTGFSGSKDASAHNRCHDQLRGNSNLLRGFKAAREKSSGTSTYDEAYQMLNMALREVLQKQLKGEGYLGNSLDDEWGYIEKYRRMDKK